MKMNLPNVTGHRVVRDFVHLVKDINSSFHLYWSNVFSSTYTFLTLYKMVNIFHIKYRKNSIIKTAATHRAFGASFQDKKIDGKKKKENARKK